MKTFIERNAEMEINLNAIVVESIKEKIKTNARDTFSTAQTEVYGMLLVLFDQFYGSNYWTEAVQALTNSTDDATSSSPSTQSGYVY